MDSTDSREEKIRKSLKYSIVDGTFYSMMVGFGESFFSAFAVFLKATNLEIGLLGSLPQALGSFSQLLSNWFIHFFKSRKRMACFFAFLQGLMYLPIAFVFFLGDFKIFYLIVFICFYFIFGMLVGPAWTSWIGDLVNEKERGSYFGFRNTIAGFASFLALVVAGFLLQHFGDGSDTQNVGFLILFLFAFLFRVVSFIYLTRKFEPEYSLDRKSEFSFFSFVTQSLPSNFGLFVLFMCAMDFFVYLAAPFFTPYMLKDLKFDYITFTVLTASAMFIKYLFMPVWGRATDRFGTRKILILSSFLMPLTPLFWVFSSNFYYLLFAQAYSGFVWAGFEISSFNYLFNTTSPQKRAICVSYMNVLRGFAVISGALVGSLIVRYNTLFGSVYLLVFMVSCFGRYIASFIFANRLKEFSKVEDLSYHKVFFSMLSVNPTMGLINNILAFSKRSKK